MKISYEEPKDLRIDAKRPIWREFFMVFVVQTVCVFAGIGLYQNHALSTLGNWGIYVALILNTIFLAAVSMLFTKINYRMTFSGVARCSQACGWRRFYGSYSATAWRWQTG